MTFLLIFFACFFLFYVAIILFASYKISKPVIQQSVRNHSNNSYTIVVPFRDEIENLKHIYSDLLDLRFDQQRLEVIFIDDHSSDGSFEWLDNCDMPTNFKLLKSSKTGKKQALTQAISQASGSFIITTDADCRLHHNWIKNIEDTIDLNNPILIVQPVISEFKDKLLHQFQYYDSLSLMGINMAVFNTRNYPSLASGANLVFQKEAFIRIDPFRDNCHIASGDDMFLLKSFLKSDPNSITLNYSPGNLVITKPENSWVKLVKQRMRWTGKMKRFSNATSFYLGLFSVVSQVILITFLVLGLWHQSYYLILFVFSWLVKTVVDYLFLSKTAQQVGQKVSWFNVFILELIYMIFVPLIVVLSLFKSPKWKGRKIRE